MNELPFIRFWKAAFKEGFAAGFSIGFEKGIELCKQELLRKCLAKGMSIKEVAELVDLAPKKVRRLAKAGSK